MCKSAFARVVLASVSVLAAGQVASAGLIEWTRWSSVTTGSPGSAAGSAFAGSLTVGYTGQVFGPSQDSLGGGVDYWVPATPYLNTVVSNAPDNRGIITLTGGLGLTQTLTFSQPVTDPVIAILSLGQGFLPVDYVFSQPITLMSSGAGYWGGGVGSLTQPDANTVRGNEGHGAILVNGTFSSLTFTVPQSETWHGFTIGFQVPEPSALSLLTLPAVMLTRRRRA